MATTVPVMVALPVTWTDVERVDPADGEVTLTVAKDAAAIHKIATRSRNVFLKGHSPPKGCRELTGPE